ncbi:MAG: DUF4124 domain-containing protein [Gammaproteobacteria bacterium]|nr:DUF4124 domain-containing protein [Gammaproteobacteria bacterium]
MNKQTIAAVVTLLLTLPFGAVASDIYKWVDEDGNVQYGDRPVGQESERVAIESRPTDRAGVQARYQASTQARTERRQAESEAAEEARKSADEKRAEEEERRQKCEASRATMQRFVTSRRLYREDESGERVYLDEAETQAARQRVENEINENCN